MGGSCISHICMVLFKKKKDNLFYTLCVIGSIVRKSKSWAPVADYLSSNPNLPVMDGVTLVQARKLSMPRLLHL